jgi:hypothetical protein
VIASPHNDHECLGALTEQLIALVDERDTALLAVIEGHETPEELASAIRAQPQRDDEGLPSDGPKVEACRPPQRFRIDAPDPNCFERSGKYIAGSELLDPSSVYRLATVKTATGLHTFPTRDGEPVILDPRQSRNTLRAGLWHVARETRNAGPVALSPLQAVSFITELAQEPAGRFVGGGARVRNADRAIRAVFIGRPLCIADVKDVAFMLALAERESHLYGPTGPRIVHTTARAIDQLDQLAAQRWLEARAKPRNAPFELRVGDYTISPDIPLLGSLARVGGRIAGNVGLEALRIKLATMGISPPVLNTVEHELNREGLTLGPMAKPPAMLGSLGALTPESIAGRWLAGKL